MSDPTDDERAERVDESEHVDESDRRPTDDETTAVEFAAARERISELGRELLEQDLTAGTGGNLSARVDENRIAVSPTGVPYPEMTPADVPVIALDGERVAGERDPSVESRMHAMVYRRRPGVGGIVHTHSPYATSFAVLREPIPATHYLVAYAGQEVPVAEYASYGTPALGENAVTALGEDRDACLLANHGVLAVGEDVESAFEVALAVEFCARVHCQAASMGEPVALPAGEIADVRERLDDYGSQE